MTSSTRNPRIDILKGIAIIAVVVIHTGWHAATTYTDALPLSIWLCVAFLSLASVPVFMLIAGYFYDGMRRRKRIGAYLIKLMKLGIIGCILLAISDIFFRPEMYDNLTARSWLRFIVLGEYPLGEPMWYIPAIIGAVLLMRLTDKTGLWPQAAPWIAGLSAVGMVLSQLPDVSPDWGRNALLMGFPLMAIGRWIHAQRQHNSQIFSPNIARCVFITGLVLAGLESVGVVHQGYPLPFTPGLLITALGLLLTAISGQAPADTSCNYLITKIIASIGRHSGGIYVIHGALFPMLAAVLPHDFIYFTGVLPILTIIGSWCIALLVNKIRTRLSRR